MANSPEAPPLHPPFPIDDCNAGQQRPWDRMTSFFQRTSQVQETPPPSGYLTLIPLSDARLQPRDNRLAALSALLFGLLIAGLVFVLVPRGVSVGEISVTTERISWNTTKASYQLRLLASVPVYNPNFLKASIEGELRILFYAEVAGFTRLDPVALHPRASPKYLDIPMDASEVPNDYILAILGQCTTFPRVLIFFLKGHLSARYLMQKQPLATVDTYFMINCEDGSVVPPSPP